jgi:hypothetical protein
MDAFSWPVRADLLTASPLAPLGPGTQERLRDAGILREVPGRAEGAVEGVARRSGLEVPRRQLRVAWDTFLARVRPGLGAKEGGQAGTRQKKRRKSKRNRAKAREAEEVEKQHWREEDPREGLKTRGWDNPAWSSLDPPVRAAWSRLIRVAATEQHGRTA